MKTSDPRQIELEEAALGYLLSATRPDLFPLDPEMFYYERYRAVITALHGKKVVSEPQAVSLLPESVIDGLGGMAEVMAIASRWQRFGVNGGDEVIRQLRERYDRRKIAVKCLEMYKLVESGEPFEHLIEQLRPANTETKWVNAADASAAALQRYQDIREGKIKLIPLRVAGLDDEHSISPGHLVIVGARSKQGKTSLVLQFTGLIAKDIPCCFYSLEMGAEELGARLLSQWSGVSLKRLADDPRYLTEHNREGLKRAGNNILSLGDNFRIVDDCYTDQAIYAHIRQMAREGVKLFVIDYLGLIEVTKSYERNDLEVASVTRNLKKLAKSLHVSIVLIGQINREGVQKDKTRKALPPEVHHLKGGGAIEADADLILLIWRIPDDAGLPTEDGQIIVAANRHGPTGVYPVKFHGSALRFDRG